MTLPSTSENTSTTILSEKINTTTASENTSTTTASEKISTLTSTYPEEKASIGKKIYLATKKLQRNLKLT
jgi:hypothetical protein